MHKAQSLINHVVLVLDGSGSMQRHKGELIKVADQQIRHLALKSEELSQETRVSVYVFDDTVECVIFDMDVMRLPSIADLYYVRGMTALVDATIKSQQDLATTSQLYGDHAFLTFVLTDGKENASSNRSFSKFVNPSEPNWTVAFLVPDSMGEAYVTRLGAHAGNVAIWDTTSAEGVNVAVNKISAATDNFMQQRTQGVRSSTNIFDTSAAAVNHRTVSSLKALEFNEYQLVDVDKQAQIRPFVQSLGYNYTQGMGYYQLIKTETIQANKNIIVVEKSSGKAYGGQDARHLIGLPDGRNVRVKPNANPQYDIYVQSTSVNRKLLPNTKLLIKA